MKKDIIERLATLTTAAFGLVAALAWNGAIQAVFKSVFGTADSIPAMLSYAVVVTVIAVLATLWIARIASKVKEGQLTAKRGNQQRIDLPRQNRGPTSR